jgi:hypothetical protein
MRDIHVMGAGPPQSLHHVRAQGSMPRAATVRKTKPERDRAGALRRARRNADRRTSGATHASRVCFAQLPHCPERQPAKSGLGTVLPRVVLIAGDRRSRRRAAHRASTGTWSPASRAHPSWCPDPRPGFPGASPAIMEHDFQTRFDCREGSGNFCVYEKSFSTSQELEARFQTT